jgi:hypothetical protein
MATDQLIKNLLNELPIYRMYEILFRHWIVSSTVIVQ